MEVTTKNFCLSVNAQNKQMQFFANFEENFVQELALANSLLEREEVGNLHSLTLAGYRPVVPVAAWGRGRGVSGSSVYVLKDYSHGSVLSTVGIAAGKLPHHH